MQTLSSWKGKLFFNLFSQGIKLFFLPFSSLLFSFLRQISTAYSFSEFSSNYFTKSPNSSCDRTPLLRQLCLHRPLSIFSSFPSNFIFRIINLFILEGSSHSLAPFFFNRILFLRSEPPKNLYTIDRPLEVFTPFDA